MEHDAVAKWNLLRTHGNNVHDTEYLVEKLHYPIIIFYSLTILCDKKNSSQGPRGKKKSNLE